MQLHQHTPFHRPRAGSLLQFLITPCMLIWNINQTFTSRDTFSFHAGMLSCVYETSECVCQSIKQGWCVSPYRQSLISYLQNLQNICKQMMPVAKEWEPLCLTQTRLALCNSGGVVHSLILLLFLKLWIMDKLKKSQGLLFIFEKWKMWYTIHIQYQCKT